MLVIARPRLVLSAHKMNKHVKLVEIEQELAVLIIFVTEFAETDWASKVSFCCDYFFTDRLQIVVPKHGILTCGHVIRVEPLE